MEKRPVKFDLYEWMVLTDLIMARPKKYQDKDHKGSDVYNLLELAIDCGSPVELDGREDDAPRASLVKKLVKYLDDGYRYIEFRPFDDRGNSLD